MFDLISLQKEYVDSFGHLDTFAAYHVALSNSIL